MLRENVICWAGGDRCYGCPHHDGKAPHCSYRPPTMLGRVGAWLTGRCSFRNIFVSRAPE